MRIKLGVWSLILSLATLGASAQDYRYDVYLDTDANASTGCTVTSPGGTISGVEARVRAEITNVTVSGSSVSSCNAGTFPAGEALPAPYAVGLNNGTAGADVIEMGTPATLAPAGTSVPAYVIGWNGASTASDVLATTNGTAGGPPILLGFPVSNIPTLGLLGLGLLVLVLAVFGMKRIRLAARASLASIGLLMMAGAVWAAAYAVDGQVGDWTGETAVATDPAGDGSSVDSGIDIRALFAGFEAGRLFLRIDVTDVENQPPVANPVSLTFLEDAAPQTITLSGSDLDGDPLTFVVATNPTQGTLGAVTPINTTSASVVYTVTPNANGPDSFTYRANDGFVNSPDATVSLTITPVNDAPVFTSQNPPAVNEDAGPQTAPVASGLSAGPADESGQTITFTITNNTNPALFSAAPTINAAGQLSYTPAANVSGTAQLTFTAQDNGGTANGGVDTAAPATITVTVNAVNDAPSFTAGANQTALEDAPAVTVAGWATAISPGPADEAGQTLTFNVTANTNTALFSVQPAVNPTNGNLTYTLAPNANGVATISLTLSDNGGTANGGQDTSAAQTFTITVTAVNDVPSFTSSGNVTVLKDTGGNTIPNWATAISAGPADEAGQTVNFQITNNSNAALFSVAPAVSPTGTLTFTTAADANGSATITIRIADNGGTANGGVDTSATQTFDITLTPVNDAPSFTPGANQTVLEDAGAQTVAAWATAISAGPPDEAGQVLTFNVTGNTNPALFSAAPAVNSTTGNLTYTPAANANGIASITLTLSDNGGTANGGNDTSAPITFTITVTAVNDVPAFTAGANQSVLEDAGAQTSAGWATAISAGPADESGQTLSFAVTGNTNAGLFSVAPAVDPTGTLTYTPAANTSGVATITLRVSDNGGTANGGVDTSATQNFTITVTSVNDVPSFVAGANQTVAEDAGAQTVAGWATAISPGPADESGQTVTFNVASNSNAALFSTAPAVSPTGTLTYTPAANANGSATIGLALQDNGGTANGGIDTSATQTFTITVTAVNDAPVNTVPGAQSVGTGATLTFTTGGGNAISIADIDAAAGPVITTVSTTLGTLSATATNGAIVTGSGTASVSITDVVADVNATLQTLSFTSGTGGTGTITVLTNDQGNTGTPGAQSDSDSFAINVDSPPTVSSTTPANGSTVANNTPLTINFSESIVATIGSVTLTCGGPNLITGGTTGTGVTVLNPTYTAPLPAGPCTMTIIAGNITDADTIDPPDNMVSTVTVNFTVDAAPTVSNVVPANGATNQPVNSTVAVTFNEPVDLAAGAFTLDCGGAQPFTTAPALPATNATSVTLTPSSALPAATSCTVTALAALVNDTDTADPPANLAANFVSTFTTDAAPTVTGGTPATGATNVATTSLVTFIFSENVDAGPGAAIAVECPIGSPVAGTVSGSGTSTLTFTPSGAMPVNTACRATAVAANINDSDVADPPGLLAADVSRTFTTDAPPSVLNTAPVAGSTGVAATSTITINFSESVAFDTTANAANTSFDFECPAGTPTNFTVSTASPAASVVLDPLDSALAGQTCTLSVRALGIADADLGDPPNNMVADFVATYTFAGVANDDAATVTPHLTYAAPVSVTANDILGAETITGFGDTLANANGTVPNGTNAITAGGAGGRIILQANGAYTFYPDAGDTSGTGTVTFFYTLSGGDTAQVTLTFEAEELAWFVDGSASGTVCTGSNVGTQACPSANFTGVSAHTTNDVIFVDSGTYTGTQTTLANGVLLLGNGSTSTISALLAARTPVANAITPVPGSDFAPYNALNGAAPVLTCTNVTCVTAGTGVTLRGFTIGDSGATGTDLAATNFGTLTVDQVLLNGTGRALNLATGTIAGAGFTGVTSTSGAHGINLSAIAGTLNLGGTTISGSSGQGINMAGITGTVNTGGTSVTATTTQGILVGTSTGDVNFGNTTVSASTDCVSLQNNSAGTRTFGTLTIGTCGGVGFLHATGGGAVTVTGATNITGVAATFAGMSVDANTSALTFNGVTVNKATAGTGVIITNSTGAVNTGVLAVTASNGAGLIYSLSSGGLTAAAGSTIAATNAQGILSLTGTNWNGQFTSVSSTNSAGAGIDLTGISGTLNIAGGAISGSAGIGLSGANALGTLTYGGSITKTSAGKLVSLTGIGAGTVTLSGALSCTGACTGIDVLNRNAGTYTFSNASKTVTTATNPAVTLSTNTGASIVFSGGGLAITTTSGAGFAATGGANSIEVTGTGNVISSTTGRALEVTNSTIGAAGLTFQSVSANGATNGILLNNTGSTAGLTVTGVAAAASGGTIQNTTGNGIRLINTRSPSFNLMSINSTVGSGIKGTGGVTNFSLTNSTISNSNDAAADGANTVDEANVAFNDNQGGTESNLTGTVTITGNTLTLARYHGIDIFNYAGTISSANISNNTITSDTVGANTLGSGIRLIAFGSATTVASVTSATINNNIVTNFPTGAGIMAQGGNANAGGPSTGVIGNAANAAQTITITNNRVSGQSAANRINTQAILTVVNGRGTGRFDVSSNGTLANPVQHTTGTSFAGSTFGNSTAVATFNNNVLVSNNQVGAQGFGIGTGILSVATETPTYTVDVTNNNISQTDGNGILLVARDATSTLRSKIQTNTVAAPLGGVRPGIRVDSGNASAGTDENVCVNLSGNTSAGSGGTNGIGLRKQGVVTTTHDFGVHNMVATTTPAVEAHVAGQNPAGNGVLLISATSGFSNCNNP